MDDLTGLPQALAGMKGRWITGAPALETAPRDWRDLIGVDTAADDAELRLLALTGHALDTAFDPVPDGELIAAAPLPELSLPCVPPAARARFRRVLASLKPDAAQTAQILTLAAARGWAVHPADWLPGKTNTDAPALYAPWVDWANAQESASALDALTTETWGDWTPALRRAELTRLRADDPAAARDLLAAKAGSVPAEERLRLVTLLFDGLCKDDAPYVQTLLKDRSSKVQNLAKRLLLRLGETKGAAGAGAPLAELCEVKRGLAGLGRRVVKIKSVKKARESKVFARFEAASLGSLATALDLTPTEVVASWSLDGDTHIRDAFLQMAAGTGDAAARAALVDRLISEKLPDIAPDALLPGITQDQRDRLIRTAVAVSGDHLAAAVRFSGANLGIAPPAPLRQSAAWSDLSSLLDEERKAEKNDWRREQTITAVLRNLGLLADPSAARALVDDLIQKGAVAADPRLDMLYLNIALSSNPPSNQRSPA